MTNELTILDEIRILVERMEKDQKKNLEDLYHINRFFGIPDDIVSNNKNEVKK